MSSSSCETSRVREITPEVLIQASKLNVGKNEHLEHYFKRITHLTLNGNDKKVITSIQLLHRCPNLKVLYMYDNEIEVVENLDGVPQMTHLHLQNNRISKMENLAVLPRLEKLYMEGNRISRLEGLGNCLYLQELHLSNQTLTPHTTFSFEQETMLALSRFLRVLNLSNCSVASTEALHVLRSLEQLDLSKNAISELEDVFALLNSLPALVELDLRHNPVTEAPRYREKVMTFSSARLALLDKKDINATQRRMMQSHLAHKYQKRQEAKQPQSNQRSAVSTSSLGSGLPMSEPTRKIHHGSTVGSTRTVQLLAPAVSKTMKPQCDGGDSFAVAGAACSRAGSGNALVRASSKGNNRKHG